MVEDEVEDEVVAMGGAAELWCGLFSPPGPLTLEPPPPPPLLLLLELLPTLACTMPLPIRRMPPLLPEEEAEDRWCLSWE